MDAMHIASAGYATYPRGATFGPRRLDSYEFVWIMKGHARAWYDRVAVDAPAGSLLLSRTGMVDEYHWDTRQPTVHAYFHFTLDAVFLATLPATSAWPMRRSVAENRLFEPLMQHVTDAMTAGQPASRVVQDCGRILLELFVGVEDGRTSSSCRKFSSPHVERAYRIMGERALQSPIQPLTLRDLAKQVNVSAGHLCLLFTREMKGSPLATYRDIRLEHGERLLARSNLSIKEIAEATGFVNQYHFSRCFREKLGNSPREFRRRVIAQPSR